MVQMLRPTVCTCYFTQPHSYYHEKQTFALQVMSKISIIIIQKYLKQNLWQLIIAHMNYKNHLIIHVLMMVCS